MRVLEYTDGQSSACFFFVAAIAAGAIGGALIAAGRSKLTRLKAGEPRPKETWLTGFYSVRRFPEDNILFGWVFVGVAVIALGAAVVALI